MRLLSCKIQKYLSLLSSFLGGAEVGEDLERRAPLLELDFPVEDDRGRNDDEVRTPNGVFAGEICEKGNGLYGFAKAHLVGKDAVQVALVHGDQPVEADMLVLAKRALEQERHFCFHLDSGFAF